MTESNFEQDEYSPTDQYDNLLITAFGTVTETK